MRGAILGGLLGLAFGLLTWVRPGHPPAPGVAGPTVEILVLDNGFHTDFVMPRAALASRPGALTTALDSLAPGDRVRVGWGDARFYVDQSPISDRLPDGARAFFRPGGNPSVLMLRPEAGDPAAAHAGEDVRRLVLSAAAFEPVRARLERSLAAPGGRPRVAATRPGDPVRFFASTETFSILHLCNHWAGEVLGAGGLAIRPVWSILSSEIGDALDAQGPGEGALDKGALDKAGVRD
jgi:hypothetical protein